ncbi:MAG: trypsin-like peptidase domain-containing protein [Planctomycetes bacterium]|nr:trypsin-like peptidase domain-containing protein [Planctomycetota bacterium]
MPRIELKSALTAFVVTLLLAIVALQFNAVGQAAYIAERVVLSAVDRQLPTPAEVDELARVNRLVARKALPAVVHIITKSQPQWDSLTEEEKKDVRDRGSRRLEEQLKRPAQAQGSGVIIDAARGFILTNNHVIDNADEIEVRLHDGRRFDGSLVGKDRMTDLAVIRIDADNLFELPIGDSDALQVGDPVMTIGNPFGYEGSVSKGIVSALDRSQIGLIDYEGFIQTDAVINPGNSGGPLVNMRAEIVGINTAIESTTGSFNGIGLAVPSARLQRVLPALIQGKQVVRGYLGVEMVSVLNAPERVREEPEILKRLDWTARHGVLVRGVVPNSPAAEAGFREDDILVHMNGDPIDSTNELTDQIANTRPGDSLAFDVWRRKQMVSLRAVVGRQPHGFSTRGRGFRRDLRNIPKPVDDSTDLSSLGIEVKTLDEGLAQRFHLQGVAAQGVVITQVDPQSNAQAKKIRPGDLIVAINGDPVVDADDLRSVLQYISRTEGLDLRLRNRRGSRHVQLEPNP